MVESRVNYPTSYNNTDGEKYFSSSPPKLQERSISEALSNQPTLTISLLLVLLIVITLVGNFFIFFTVYVTKRLHEAAFFFVASLSVADFMVGLLVIPVALVFQVALEMKEYTIYSVELCDAWIFANTWFCSASILNLCAISWDRYVAIISPLRYAVRMSRSRVKKMLLCIWVKSFMFSFLAWFGVKASPSRIHYCSTEGMNLEYALPVVIVLFILPVCFLVFANGKIILVAHAQLKKIKAQSKLSLQSDSTRDQELQPYGQRTTLQRKIEFSRMSKEIKTLKLFLTVIGVFVSCWLPFFVITIISSIKPITEVDGSIKLLFISLGYVNSACNVFIYGFLNKDFRKALALTIRRKWDARQLGEGVRRNTLGRGIDNESYVSSSLPR